MRIVRHPARRTAAALAAVALSAAALLAGCGGDDAPPPSPAEELAQRIRETQARLVEQIGEAACASVSQCAAMPIGAKACGGPSGHLAYSTVSGDQAAIASLAQEHRTLSAQLNALLGLASDCSVEMPPPLACRQGRCVFEAP
jgi:hypothetical protein